MPGQISAWTGKQALQITVPNFAVIFLNNIASISLTFSERNVVGGDAPVPSQHSPSFKKDIENAGGFRERKIQ